MILKGSQRAGGNQLAAHLLKTTDNEHVHVHELRGFLSDDLKSAFHETYAVSRGTRAKQFLFSLSLNPPPNEKVSIDTFEAAIETVEQKLGLDDQPRAVVFHEKDGRRHAHVVWSRIDAEKMKAINLPHFKLKLRDVSKELYLEHGWQMPRGFVDSKERDPVNFTHHEWQQAKRAGHDPKALKRMFQECWSISDSPKAFRQALQARGYYLARGDRRGYVAVDYRGEVYAIAKYVGVRTKQVRSRLGDASNLPSVEQAKTAISSRMSNMLRQHVEEIEKRRDAASASLSFRRTEIVQRQRAERTALDKSHEERTAREAVERSQRLRKGFRGLWDRLIGQHAKAKRQNEFETAQSVQRDRAEKERLISRQLDERRTLHQQIKWGRQANTKELEELHRDIAGYMQMAGKEPPDLRKHFRDAHGQHERLQTRKHDRDRDPELER